MFFNAKQANLWVELDNRGRVAGIRHHGVEFAFPAEEMFTMLLLDKNGNELLLKSSEFEFDGTVWSGHWFSATLKVVFSADADEKFVRFRPQVTGIPSELTLCWFDGPQVAYTRHRNLTLLQPLHDGVEISEPIRRPIAEYHPIGFSRRGVRYGTAFPGRAQLQFMAVYDDRGGFYFAAHDSHCATKAVEYEVRENLVRLSLQTFTGCGFGEDYLPDFDYVLSGFDGGWKNAAEIYRNWLESRRKPIETDFPPWMEKSPVIVIYPVRGHGLDTGEMEPNDYFPYRNFLPYAKKFNEAFHAPVMALLMHWEGTAPWAPPYVWPPFGGEVELADFRDALHADGNLLGVYCSGTAWTCRSCVLPEYAPGCSPEQEKLMLRGPHGELEATVCNGLNSQRLGYDLCLNEPSAEKIVFDEIMKLADFGLDYAQFFDQNHGGGLHNCFARDHRHPPVPGVWQTDCMRCFMQKVEAEMRRRGSDMLLGCESASAEPYAEYLKLNDARASFMYSRGNPVPLHQYMFHGISANFAGNQCGAANEFDFDRSPENLNRRLAYAFNAGDLLSITLKEDGHAHWCWAYPWDSPSPNQDSLFMLIQHLNALRTAHPDYLLRGKMLPLPTTVTGDNVIEYDRYGSVREVPAWFCNAWNAPDGRRALIAVNYLEREQTLVIGGECHRLPPCDGLVLEY